MRLSMTYTPCVSSMREQTGDIIMFTQFEEGNSPSEKNHRMVKQINNLKLVTIQ